MTSPLELTRFIQHDIAALGVPGTYRELEKLLPTLPTQALHDLHRLLRAADERIRDAERTFRPFPGGPRIRM